jgi:hypothetical protein
LNSIFHLSFIIVSFSPTRNMSQPPTPPQPQVLLIAVMGPPLVGKTSLINFFLRRDDIIRQHFTNELKVNGVSVKVIFLEVTESLAACDGDAFVCVYCDDETKKELDETMEAIPAGKPRFIWKNKCDSGNEQVPNGVMGVSADTGFNVETGFLSVIKHILDARQHSDAIAFRQEQHDSKELDKLSGKSRSPPRSPVNPVVPPSSSGFPHLTWCVDDPLPDDTRRPTVPPVVPSSSVPLAPPVDRIPSVRRGWRASQREEQRQQQEEPQREDETFQFPTNEMLHDLCEDGVIPDYLVKTAMYSQKQMEQEDKLIRALRAGVDAIEKLHNQIRKVYRDAGRQLKYLGDQHDGIPSAELVRELRLQRCLNDFRDKIKAPEVTEGRVDHVTVLVPRTALDDFIGYLTAKPRCYQCQVSPNDVSDFQTSVTVRF